MGHRTWTNKLITRQPQPLSSFYHLNANCHIEHDNNPHTEKLLLFICINDVFLNYLFIYFYLRADWSLPNRLVVWSILGYFNAGLAPKIPECLRRICECFLSSSAGLWCVDRDLMRDAAAAPTDWDLNGVLSIWCPRSILMEREFLFDTALWLALSFP